jgi:hypothetical protein
MTFEVFRPMLVRRILVRSIQTLIVAALLSRPAASQSGSSISLGATWLDFNLGDFGALSAQLRLQQGPAELSALGIIPLGKAAAVTGCPINVFCAERSTPDILWGGVVSLSTGLGSSGLRGSAGVGVIAASGIEGPDRTSSAAGSVGLDWAPASGRGLTFGVRALGLSSSIAGMRYIVLPSIGFSF